MSTIEVRTATEVSEERLARFYGQMHPERAAFLTEHWRWRYRVGTFDSVLRADPSRLPATRSSPSEG